MAVKKAVVENKEKSAKINGAAVAYTLGLILMAFLVIIVSSFLLPAAPFIQGEQCEGRLGGCVPNEAPSADLNRYFTLRLVLSVVNTLLAVYLLFIYVRNYLTIKSSFTLGIVAFVFSFLMYALSSIPLLHTLFGPFMIASVFSFVPMLFSAVGLIIFAKLSNE